MNPGQVAIIKAITKLFENLQSSLASPDEGDDLELLLGAYRCDSRLAEKGWLTLSEAAAWIGRSRKYINRKINERRLWCQRIPGRGGGEIRIPKAHLDEQMALGFPVLKIEPRAVERLDAARAAAKMAHDTRPLKDIIPGPERDDANLPPPRVY